VTDSFVNQVGGYIEYTYLDPTPEVYQSIGYIEYTYLDPQAQINKCFGLYRVDRQHQSPIALTEDSQINNLIGYIEYTLYHLRLNKQFNRLRRIHFVITRN